MANSSTVIHSATSSFHLDTPKRDYMDNPEIEWRNGKPNYDLSNLKYLSERSRKHGADSLEKLVENLVKTWEMESTHKINVKVIEKSKSSILINP